MLPLHGGWQATDYNPAKSAQAQECVKYICIGTVVRQLNLRAAQCLCFERHGVHFHTQIAAGKAGKRVLPAGVHPVTNMVKTRRTFTLHGLVIGVYGVGVAAS